MTKLDLNDLFDGNQTRRDLDAYVAENLCGWVLTHVGADVNGENACEVLTPFGSLSSDFSLPPKGIIGRGYFAPLYTSRLPSAVSLATKYGFTAIDLDFSCDLGRLPEMIVRAVIKQRDPSLDRKAPSCQ